MKKKLPASDIANELSGHSVFFTAKEKSKPEKPPEIPEESNTTADKNTESASVAEKPHSPASTPSGIHDTVIPRYHETKILSDQPQVVTQNPSTTTPTTEATELSPELLEEVRKVVKQLGKEAATHRFSLEEKRAIADLVYSYNRQGYRTSENEITRIAINWLLIDFRERGAQSVLARMLEVLHG
jgi:hypothetical protein